MIGSAIAIVHINDAQKRVATVWITCDSTRSSRHWLGAEHYALEATRSYDDIKRNQVLVCLAKLAK